MDTVTGLTFLKVTFYSATKEKNPVCLWNLPLLPLPFFAPPPPLYFFLYLAFHSPCPLLSWSPGHRSQSMDSICALHSSSSWACTHRQRPGDRCNLFRFASPLRPVGFWRTSNSQKYLNLDSKISGVIRQTSGSKQQQEGARQQLW